MQELMRHARGHAQKAESARRALGADARAGTGHQCWEGRRPRKRRSMLRPLRRLQLRMLQRMTYAKQDDGWQSQLCGPELRGVNGEARLGGRRMPAHMSSAPSPASRRPASTAASPHRMQAEDADAGASSGEAAPKRAPSDTSTPPGSLPPHPGARKSAGAGVVERRRM